MYTSGRTVKSKARKPAGLTVAKATADVRRLVDRIVPSGPDVSVTSRMSYDLEAEIPTVVTVVTFPVGHSAALKAALAELSNLHRIDAVTPGWIEITRKR